MTTKWEKFGNNNQYVDAKLLQTLGKLTTAVKVVEVRSSGFAINHPLDSNMFREAIKGVDRRQPSIEMMNAVTNSARL